eukprot:5989921-Pyramimonas_sp.AAC.1
MEVDDLKGLPKDPQGVTKRALQKDPPEAPRKDVPKDLGLAVDTDHPPGEVKVPPPRLRGGTETGKGSHSNEQAWDQNSRGPGWSWDEQGDGNQDAGVVQDDADWP